MTPITIRYASWRRFMNVGCAIALPAVAVLFLHPARPVEIGAYVVIFTAGVSGALVAFLQRTGGIRFTYTDADRRRRIYRLSKLAALYAERGDDKST